MERIKRSLKRQTLALLLLILAAVLWANPIPAQQILVTVLGGTGQSTYTTGDTLYASASNTLSKLSIGSTGNVLTVAGGVPTWAAPTSGAIYGWSGLRLSLDNSHPVAGDLAGTTSIYLDPYLDNNIWTYDSSVWTLHSVSSYITGTNSGLSASTFYYVYVYYSSGLTLDISTTGTAVQNGVYVKSGATNERLVGTLYTDTSSKFDDYGGGASGSPPKRNVCNWQNKVYRPLFCNDTSTARSTTSTTFVQVGSVQGEYVTDPTNWVKWHGMMGVYNATSGDGISLGIGSSTTAAVGNCMFGVIRNPALIMPLVTEDTEGSATFQHLTRYLLWRVEAGTAENAYDVDTTLSQPATVLSCDMWS